MPVKMSDAVRGFLCVCSIVLLASPAGALETEKLRVQRKEVFEFSEKPKVTWVGDTITVTFSVKDFCDATVAIEDAGGKILRHVASGVLGKNAPEPFQKDSLKQTLVWDGKDELGRYLDKKEQLTVRVSLGLKAQMERTLYWCGLQMANGSRGTNYLSMKAAPEGVYVYSAGDGAQLRLYDHAGNYLRTVYPFPREKIEAVKGLNWQAYPPDGEKLPNKLIGAGQDTFLPDSSVRDFAVQGDRLALASSRAMFMSIGDPNSPLTLAGPEVGYKDESGGVGSEDYYRPYAAAFSPDGKRLYLTSYTRRWNQPGYPTRRSWYQGVNVVDVEKSEVKLFAGVMLGKDAGGGDNAHFRCPSSVATDAKGRVYIADNFNNRIQVYQPDGTFLKSIATPRPGLVRIDPSTQDIWVVSSSIGIYNGKEIGLAEDAGYGAADLKIRQLGPVEDPKEKQAVPLPPLHWDYNRLNAILDYNVELDFHAKPMMVWTSVASDATSGPPHIRCNAQLWTIEGGKLILKRKFADEAERSMLRSRAAHFTRPRLWASPASGMVYLGLIGWDSPVACKSVTELVAIDPATGALKVVGLPTNPEDIGFDWLGRAYLRVQDAVVRFDPVTWREVPYDYGEERMVNHDDGTPRPFKSSSAMILPSCIGGMFHMGGIGVAPDGTTAISCINPNNPDTKKLMADKKVGAGASTAYVPPVYPGRNMGWETHVFDPQGKALKTDVAPGIAMSNFVQIDRAGSVYLLLAGTPYLDGKVYFNGRGCTLVKVKPGKFKALTAGGIIPLAPEVQPKRPMDITRPGLWLEGAEWHFGPVGADGHYGSGGKCDCYVNARFALDYYGRSFAPEVDRFRVVVLDTAGNVILRIGRYGNVDDGVPLVKPDPALAGKMGAQPPAPRSIGGDETAIMHTMNLTVVSDRRLVLADTGNQCIRSVKLGYHAGETVALKDVANGGKVGN